MHKVVVTGGLGFIGSHVVDGLLAAGRQVTVIDSMVSAVTDGREYEVFPDCVVHRVSIADYLAQGGTFEGADLVVHTASHVGPAGILVHQGTLGAEIVATTQDVIDECVAHDVALVTFSSAEVYGRSGMLGGVRRHHRADALQRAARVRDRQDADRGRDDQQPPPRSAWLS